MNEVPDSFGSLFLGYTAVWGILAVYIIFLVNKIRKLEKRLDAASSSKKEEAPS